jgi:hypothetical protein
MHRQSSIANSLFMGISSLLVVFYHFIISYIALLCILNYLNNVFNFLNILLAPSPQALYNKGKIPVYRSGDR